MQRHVWLVFLLLALAAPASFGSQFERDFENATLRVDLHHVGDAEQEFVSIDRLYRQGPWAGPRSRLVDPFAYGGYVVEARDAADGVLLFSKGFDNYFGEYRTTGAAADGIMKAYHETVLLPFPKRSLEITYTARRRDGTTIELLRTTIDPSSTAIATEPPRSGTIVVAEHIGGPPAEVLDIAIVGEGYRLAETDRFQADLSRAAKALLGQEPFAANHDRISIRGVLAFSAESGCDEPTRGTYRDTAIGATFNSLGSERYMLTEDNRRLRDIAASAPYDALVIMVNHDRYGGGGIYNTFCTFTAHSEWADYLLLHEFCHSFAGLADEYYSSSTAYNDFYPRGHEPVDANITALLDPEKLKWKDLVAPGTELPTPWGKEAYDLEDAAYQIQRKELNEAIATAVRTGSPEDVVAELKAKEQRHAADHAQWAWEYLAKAQGAGTVGAFEGAGYSKTGLYRPTLDCLMFSRRVQPFCPVCERAVEAMVLRCSE